jgi:phosphoribosylformimino-5-aminoimidazole carboxamide ribotide isomerase
MIVYPAVDLRHGRVVQLIGGRPEAERLSLDDPVAVAEGFVAAGFRHLHLVDLDAALGEGSNLTEVEAIVEKVTVPVQVGGGIRDKDMMAAILAIGAARVIVGTRAITDSEWLAEVSRDHPQQVVVAADVRNEEIVTHGWQSRSGIVAGEFLARVSELPLGGLLITDVNREGSLGGINVDLFARLNGATDLPIIAAGGVGSMQDLRSLDSAGIAGAVIGTALYTGAVEPGVVAKEFVG